MRSWRPTSGHKAGYHYTAPSFGLVSVARGHAAGVQGNAGKAFSQHRHCSHALQAGITALGLSLYVQQAEARLDSVVGIRLPDGVDSKTLCQHISRHYRVEIAGHRTAHRSNWPDGRNNAGRITCLGRCMLWGVPCGI